MAVNECSGPPAPGADTTIMAESLLERAERLATVHHDHHHMHTGSLDKHAWDAAHAHSSAHHTHPHFHSLKLRRERSCHDIPIKEVGHSIRILYIQNYIFPPFPAQTSAMYTLQRRIRVLRDQLQKKDLQLELFKRKLTLLEEGARGKCLVLVSLFFSIEFRRALPQPASSFRSE